MAGNNVNATQDLTTWKFQENYVERLMDNAAFTAAHPNNTLVLAGPARFGSVENADDDLLPVGMVQNMQVNQQRPVQPMQGIGSSRTFFVAGKSSIQFRIGRLLINGRNLLRALYTQAVQNDIAVNKFDEPPVSASNEEQYYLNLDSELFYIPIGLAVLFRSVAHDAVGAFYIELCMFNSWRVAFQAGQAMIMENVGGLADRIRPIYPGQNTGQTDQNNPFTPGTPDTGPVNDMVFPTQDGDVTPNLDDK